MYELSVRSRGSIYVMYINTCKHNHHGTDIDHHNIEIDGGKGTRSMCVFVCVGMDTCAFLGQVVHGSKSWSISYHKKERWSVIILGERIEQCPDYMQRESGFLLMEVVMDGQFGLDQSERNPNDPTCSARW